MLIDDETNTAYKQSLEREKTDCLKKLVELTRQTPPTTQLLDQTQSKDTLTQHRSSQQTITSQTNSEVATQLSTHQEAQSLQSPATPVITQSQPTLHNPIAEKYVTFHNDVNSVSLGRLSALETNLLFAIFQKLKDKQDDLLVFNIDEIKAMVHAVKISKNELSGVVKRLWKNIRLANFWILYPRAEESIMLFRKFRINYHDTQKTQVKSIEIQVNMPYFGYLLNFLNANFTSFELLEFQGIRSKYAKTLYRLLKQWKSTGVPPKREWSEFRELMGIPASVKLLEVVERAILKPALKELHKLPHFENLCYEKLKTKGMGNRITHIQFYFQPLTKTSKDKEQAQRDLRTIAWEITSKQTIKEIKKSIKQRKQTKQDEAMMQTLGMAFCKPKEPNVFFVIENIQREQEGYKVVAKYYRDDKEFQEKSVAIPNQKLIL
ncbi:replication initiation protein [Helicobacter labacensis]|uniref:replication initiation protein n=1 Tax=Helicobacter labacensis TaxID=2316079 RepID=UPI000EB2C890|nr:replication initiation protein [Helicobacter labacensis]